MTEEKLYKVTSLNEYGCGCGYELLTVGKFVTRFPQFAFVTCDEEFDRISLLYKSSGLVLEARQQSSRAELTYHAAAWFRTDVVHLVQRCTGFFVVERMVHPCQLCLYRVISSTLRLRYSLFLSTQLG